jgi:glycosyltransferase involved in cell wall biosynthesis
VAAALHSSRILLIHNYYGSESPSGENQVFEAEKALLVARGHEVIEVTRNSDDIRSRGALGLAIGALATPWNPWMANAVSRAVQQSRPAIVHAHNTFPLISPAIFSAVGQGTARVLTLHNYRVFCPAAIPMRDGQICTQCLDRKSSIPSLKYGCYRSSRLATIPVATSVTLHRWWGTWTRHVDAFIALSTFQSERLVKAGLPRDRVHVKPNFFAGDPVVSAWDSRQNCCVYVGRLSAEKGIETLLQAWIAWGEAAPELRVIGDGPMASRIHDLVRAARGARIRLLGRLAPGAAEQQIATAKLLIVPSECFEGFPMVIREAFAFGTPVAASNLGPLPTIVTPGVNGLLFEPRTAQSILDAVGMAWRSPPLLERLGAGARRSFETHYNEAVNYTKLMEIYQHAVDQRRTRDAELH